MRRLRQNALPLETPTAPECVLHADMNLINSRLAIRETPAERCLGGASRSKLGAAALALARVSLARRRIPLKNGRADSDARSSACASNEFGANAEQRRFVFRCRSHARKGVTCSFSKEQQQLSQRHDAPQRTTGRYICAHLHRSIHMRCAVTTITIWRFHHAWRTTLRRVD